MSAPPEAKPLGEFRGFESWTFTCGNCGHKGTADELLETDDMDILWCPICHQVTWEWDCL